MYNFIKNRPQSLLLCEKRVSPVLLQRAQNRMTQPTQPSVFDTLPYLSNDVACGDNSEVLARS